MAKKLSNPNSLTEAFFGNAAEVPEPQAVTQDNTKDTGAQGSPAAEKERRTERVQILLTPSEHDTLRRLAYLQDRKYSQLILDALRNTYKEFKENE